MAHLQRVNSEGIARADFGETVRTYGAGFVSQKLRTEAIEAATGQKVVDNNGIISYTHDARSESLAKGWGNYSADQVTAMFATGASSRNRSSLDKRAAYAAFVGNNLTTLRATDNGRLQIQKLNDAMNQTENADVFKHFYLNVMGQSQDDVDKLNPQTSSSDFSKMKTEIQNRLR